MTKNGNDDPTMIERVAQAIWMCNRPEGAPDYDELSNMDQFQVEAIARECIRAMREPTKGMVGNWNKHTNPIDTWTEMIDAALKED